MMNGLDTDGIWELRQEPGDHGRVILTYNRGLESHTFAMPPREFFALQDLISSTKPGRGNKIRIAPWLEEI